jgi:hypothetical protein
MKRTAKAPTPHCKGFRKSNGKRGKICFDGKGKITSSAKVAAYHKRKR